MDNIKFTHPVNQYPLHYFPCSNLHVSVKQINDAIAANCMAYYKTYHGEKPVHEHPDCVALAMQWLDAQRRIMGTTGKPSIKHMVESWAKRYISKHDVEVAAKLLGIGGRYPYFNISSKLVYPIDDRKAGIDEAGKHQDYAGRYSIETDGYVFREAWETVGDRQEITHYRFNSRPAFSMPFGSKMIIVRAKEVK